jgi:hypothetical protein
VTFSVDPSDGSAAEEGSVLELGDTGVSEDFEQAMAIASMAVAEQRTNLFWSINFSILGCCWGVRTGRAKAG